MNKNLQKGGFCDCKKTSSIKSSTREKMEGFKDTFKDIRNTLTGWYDKATGNIDTKIFIDDVIDPDIKKVTQMQDQNLINWRIIAGDNTPLPSCLRLTFDKNPDKPDSKKIINMNESEREKFLQSLSEYEKINQYAAMTDYMTSDEKNNFLNRFNENTKNKIKDEIQIRYPLIPSGIAYAGMYDCKYITECCKEEKNKSCKGHSIYGYTISEKYPPYDGKPCETECSLGVTGHTCKATPGKLYVNNSKKKQEDAEISGFDAQIYTAGTNNNEIQQKGGIFKIKCRFIKEDISWIISRTYTNFRVLRDELLKDNIYLEIPRKHLFRSKTDSVIADRHDAFSKILRVIKNHLSNKTVREFLNIEYGEMKIKDDKSLKTYNENKITDTKMLPNMKCKKCINYKESVFYFNLFILCRNVAVAKCKSNDENIINIKNNSNNNKSEILPLIMNPISQKVFSPWEINKFPTLLNNSIKNYQEELIVEASIMRQAARQAGNIGLGLTIFSLIITTHGTFSVVLAIVAIVLVAISSTEQISTLVEIENKMGSWNSGNKDAWKAKANLALQILKNLLYNAMSVFGGIGAINPDLFIGQVGEFLAENAELAPAVGTDMIIDESEYYALYFGGYGLLAYKFLKIQGFLNFADKIDKTQGFDQKFNIYLIELENSWAQQFPLTQKSLEDPNFSTILNNFCKIDNAIKKIKENGKEYRNKIKTEAMKYSGIETDNFEKLSLKDQNTIIKEMQNKKNKNNALNFYSNTLTLDNWNKLDENNKKSKIKEMRRINIIKEALSFYSMSESDWLKISLEERQKKLVEMKRIKMIDNTLLVNNWEKENRNDFRKLSYINKEKKLKAFLSGKKTFKNLLKKSQNKKNENAKINHIYKTRKPVKVRAQVIKTRKSSKLN